MNPPSTKLRTFEYRIFRRLKALELGRTKILVGCSGGMDSIALVYCLSRIASRLNLTIEVATLHHGPTNDLGLRDARKNAFATAQKFAKDLGIAVHVAKSPKNLTSEESLRDFRHQALKKIAQSAAAEWIALAHHADDLLETRLIRLVRGTGPQGLRAMSEREAHGILRPFLRESRHDIVAYARERGLSWCEDPSNKDLAPLRNWMRNSWLPQLEAKRKGSMRSLERSLESIAESVVEEATPIAPITVSAIDKKVYLQLGISKRRQWLAATLLKLGARNFGTSHIEEIRKRVEAPRDSGQKRRSFQLLKMNWHINAQQIVVRRI